MEGRGIFREEEGEDTQALVATDNNTQRTLKTVQQSDSHTKLSGAGFTLEGMGDINGNQHRFDLTNKELIQAWNKNLGAR